MFAHLPAAIGHALANQRAGLDALLLADPNLAPASRPLATLTVASPDFAHEGPLPLWCTDDGEGRSPSVHWSDVPAGAASLALLVEDADSPTPRPLVHAIVGGLAAADGGLAAGSIGEDAGAGAATTGRNSFLAHAWLPPDPPPGHGPHRYVFQLYALDHAPAFTASTGRSELLAALRDHVVGLGVLVGTYERTA